MPTILTEETHAGEHIVSEASGHRSREALTVAAEQTLATAQVVAQLTADDNVVALNQDGADGSEVAIGVLYEAVTTAAGETASAVVHVRDCEIRSSDLAWPSDITSGEKDTAIAELKALGIILR